MYVCVCIYIHIQIHIDMNSRTSDPLFACSIHIHTYIYTHKSIICRAAIGPKLEKFNRICVHTYSIYIHTHTYTHIHTSYAGPQSERRRSQAGKIQSHLCAHIFNTHTHIHTKTHTYIHTYIHHMQGHNLNVDGPKLEKFNRICVHMRKEGKLIDA
jgi:hypothetical protein